MEISDHLTGFLRNLYASQEATVKTLYWTTVWFTIEKAVWQGCLLSPCLFNLHTEHMRNAGLDELQAGIKISGRNINNLRCADDTTLTAESKEKLKSLLMRMKKESERAGLKLNIKKTKIMASGPITSWQMQRKWKQWQVLFSWAPKSLRAVTVAMKLKDTCFLEENLWWTAIQFSSFQLLSHVQLFAIPWIAACQASLSITNPGIYSNSRPLSRWCHPTISSSVIPFSSRFQSFPPSGSFQMSQIFAAGGQSIGVSALASVLPKNTQDSSLLEWTG